MWRGNHRPLASQANSVLTSVGVNGNTMCSGGILTSESTVKTPNAKIKRSKQRNQNRRGALQTVGRGQNNMARIGNILLLSWLDTETTMGKMVCTREIVKWQSVTQQCIEMLADRGWLGACAL